MPSLSDLADAVRLFAIDLDDLQSNVYPETDNEHLNIFPHCDFNLFEYPPQVASYCLGS